VDGPKNEADVVLKPLPVPRNTSTAPMDVVPLTLSPVTPTARSEMLSPLKSPAARAVPKLSEVSALLFVGKTIDEGFAPVMS
jgi:hypothetical protein